MDPDRHHLPAVQAIRSASRDMVRELGFMNRHLAGTDLTASQVHALIELDRHPSLPAATLTALLRLDKSATSRLAADLERRGLVKAHTGGADRRVKPLALTASGRAKVREIHRTAGGQVAAAVQRLSAAQGGMVAEGLRLYAGALRATRAGESVPEARDDPRVSIASGYQPGAIGEVVALQGRYYARHAGFGAFFEQQVADEMAQFMRRFDPRADGFWLARRGGWSLGSVSIDASRRNSAGARLRWFIVDESLQGTGVGSRLIAAALAHCDKMGFRKIYLTTFAGLDAARHLYERHGFVLRSEAKGAQWGRQKLEQRFERVVKKG